MRAARLAALPMLPLGPVVQLLATPVAAQPPDTSNWTCQRCPFPSGYEAAYAAGASYVSDDAARFGDATGYDEKGGYVRLGGEGTYVGADQHTRWELEDLGLDAHALGVEGGRPGRFAYALEYEALPERTFDTTRTVFSGGPDVLVLPAAWVNAGTTAGFDALGSSLYAREIASDRTMLGLGGRLERDNGFDFFADYRRTERDGVETQGGAYYTNASLLARPFDYATDEIDLGVRRTGARSSVKLAYYGSFFDDASRSVTWENPFLAAPGAETAALARPPDSSFQQLSVSGHARLQQHDAALTYTLARGLGEQDGDLLAYTTNPNLPSFALPRSRLDGRIETTNLAVTGSLRPHRRIRLGGSYRYDDRDDETPVDAWNRVIVDTFVSDELETNTPYGFTRSRLSLSIDYDVLGRLRLSAGYDDAEVERDHQEVAQQDEATGWGQLLWQATAALDLRARAGTSKRDVDEYDTGIGQSLGQSPLMRKYNLAYRYREFIELTLTGALPNRPISLGATYRRADDSYTQSLAGLLASDVRHYSIDLSWASSSTSSLYLTAGLDELESVQAGAASSGAPGWRATHDDEFESVTAGYRATQLTRRIGLEVDYTRGEGRSDIVTGTPFPSLESTLDSLRMRVGYALSDRLDGSFELRYERFEARDWALAGVAPDAVPNLLSLGAEPYDYDVLLVGVAFRYSLDAP